MAASLPLVLLTNPIDPAGEAILKPHARLLVAPDTSPATLNRLAGDAHGIIVRVHLPADIIDHAPQLVAIARHGAGLDMIPVAAATARRIPVSYVPGANAAAVAEYCFAAMLALRRRLVTADAVLRNDGWAAARAVSAGAGELGGKSLGIIGFGQIGRRVAAIGAGFGMKVLTATRRPDALPEAVTPLSMEALFEQSDMIVLCCPLTPETRGIVNAALLARVKSGAILVNVSRGAVVVEAALIEALGNGRLAGAALDVFDTQPLPADHPYFARSNLLLTPHLAGLTDESMKEMSLRSAADMVSMLRGERPTCLANPEIYQS